MSVRCVIEHIFHTLDREFTSSDRHAFKFGLQKNDYKKYETGANSNIGGRGDPLQVSNRSIATVETKKLVTQTNTTSEAAVAMAKQSLEQTQLISETMVGLMEQQRTCAAAWRRGATGARVSAAQRI